MKKILSRLSRKPRHVLKLSKRKLRRSMLKIKVALSQEKAETREMLHIYHMSIRGETKPGEMKIANKQFFDIVKGLGLGVFAVLPFAPITIPIIVKLGKTVGVDILPSAFNTPQKEEKPAQIEDRSPSLHKEPLNKEPLNK
jgi:hypothetical protein